jgi:hypothetical protein
VVYKAVRKSDHAEFAVKCIKKKMVEGDDIKLLRFVVISSLCPTRVRPRSLTAVCASSLGERFKS